MCTVALNAVYSAITVGLPIQCHALITHKIIGAAVFAIYIITGNTAYTHNPHSKITIIAGCLIGWARYAVYVITRHTCMTRQTNSRASLAVVT